MIELSFLGTGGWIATTERDNTSFFIHHDDDLILVDCPGSVIQKTKRLNFDPQKISSILITHIHPDHVYGLPSLVHSLMFEKSLINLYGSKEAVGFCQDFLDLFHLREKRIKCRINFVSLKPDQGFSLSPSLACVTLHAPHSPSSLAYHFHFKPEKKEMLYSGDISVHVPLFEKAAGMDVLIHECSAPMRYFQEHPSLNDSHTNSLELGRLAQQSGVKCLIPCHFFGDLGFSMSEIEVEIKKNYKGKLIIPHDLEKITL